MDEHEAYWRFLIRLKILKPIAIQNEMATGGRTSRNPHRLTMRVSVTDPSARASARSHKTQNAA